MKANKNRDIFPKIGILEKAMINSRPLYTCPHPLNLQLPHTYKATKRKDPLYNIDTSRKGMLQRAIYLHNTSRYGSVAIGMNAVATSINSMAIGMSIKSDK